MFHVVQDSDGYHVTRHPREGQRVLVSRPMYVQAKAECSGLIGFEQMIRQGKFCFQTPDDKRVLEKQGDRIVFRNLRSDRRGGLDR